jgi:hypothetical protein
MKDLPGFPTGISHARRALFLAIPAALATHILSAQNNAGPPPIANQDEDIRLPSGRKQKDEILKADYEQNVKDAQELVMISRSFEEDLEKDDRYVLSIASLKKLDDIEKLTKRIRGRLKRY